MIGILCTSPLHIMIAFSLKMNQYKNEEMQMILLDYSVGMERLKEKILETGLFADVFYLKANNIFRKYVKDKFFRAIFLLSGISVIKEAGIPWQKYAELLFPYRDPIVVLLARNYKKQRIKCKYIYYDDGTALYVDSGTMVCNKPSRLEKLLGVPDELYTPCEGFVFAPELLCFPKNIKLHKISFQREENLIYILNKVFEYEKITKCQYIVFDSCDVAQDTPLDIEEINQIIRIAKNQLNDKNVYIKKHPKRIGTYYEDVGLRIFPSKVSLPFELYLLNEGCEDSSVLVSEFSTAAIAPIVMFGDEPRLIFLHHMMKFYSEEMKEEIDKFLQKISKLYKENGKICIAHSDQDLEEFLDGGK